LQFMSWYLSGLWIEPKEAAAGGYDPSQEVRGNGPYLLEDYQPAVSFTFVRNPDWYAGPDVPYVDRIEMPIIEDAAQAESQFRAGNIHWGGVSTPSIPIVAKEVSGTEVLQLPASFAGSTFGMNRIPESGFNDPRVRKALSMSLDRDTFIEVINDPASFEDVGITVNRFWNTPLSAGYGAFWLDPKGADAGPGAANLQHNVAEAKKLLAAADYDDSNQFEFDLIFPGTRYGRDWPTRAETWQSMAADAGIKVNLVVLDYTTEWIPAPPEGVFRTFSVFEGPNSKSAVTFRPNGGRSTPGEWFNTFFQSVGSNNEVGENWPDLDTLITEARGLFDFEERVAKVHEIQRFMMENMVTIPVLPTTDIMSIKHSGLVGPGSLHAWGGGAGERNSHRETYPWFWLDDPLQT
jgi:ABC-type transport system substrate-binding protein